MTKLDLEDHARKAAAAHQDEWVWSNGELQGKHTCDALLFANHGAKDTDEPAIIVSWNNRVHIAANSPPVVQALLRRITELEAALLVQQDRLDAFHERYTAEKTDPLSYRELLEKGAVLP